VQNRIPSQTNSRSSGLSKEELDQAYERARAHLMGESLPTEPTPTPICNTAGPGKRTVDPLLDGAELLRAICEPVEWVLVLAHKLAGTDSVDVAAIARLRAAFHAWLAGRPAGIRKSDLLVVFGLLVGALDPSVVVNAVSDTIGDALAEELGSESPLVLQITDTVALLASLVKLLAALPPPPAGGLRPACPVRSHLVR